MADSKSLKNKKIRSRKKTIHHQIKDQMEFYFSSANLQKDRYLNQLIKQSPDGMIELDVFLKFNKIKSMTTEIDVIVKAVSSSTILKVDSSKVGLIVSYSEPTDSTERTVYVECLPYGADIDWIKKQFSECGKVVYVSLPKYKSTRDIKGFAFVEFETVTGVEMACKLLNNPPVTLEELKPGWFPKSKKERELEKQVNKIQRKKDLKRKLSQQETKTEENKFPINANGSVNNNNSAINELVKTELVDQINLTKRTNSFTSLETTNKKLKLDNYDNNQNANDFSGSHLINSPINFQLNKNDANRDDIELENVNERFVNKNDLEEINLGFKKNNLIKEITEINKTEKVDQTVDVSEKAESKIIKKKKKNKKKVKNTSINDYVEIQDINNTSINNVLNENNNTHINNIESNNKIMETNKIKKKKNKKKIDSSIKNQIEQNNDNTVQVLTEKSINANIDSNNENKKKDEKINKKSILNVENEDSNFQKDKINTTSQKKKDKRVTLAKNIPELRVIQKSEWLQLRKEYLQKQKESMQELKTRLNFFKLKLNPGGQSMEKKPYPLNNYCDNDKLDDGEEVEKRYTGKSPKKLQIDSNLGKKEQPLNIDSYNCAKSNKMEFVPNVVLAIELKESLKRMFLREKLSNYGKIAYVDLEEGTCQAYVRCVDQPHALNIEKEQFDWCTIRFVQGEEEQAYWVKAFDDREKKLQNPVKKKIRGRDKLQKRADKCMKLINQNKHMIFE